MAATAPRTSAALLLRPTWDAAPVVGAASAEVEAAVSEELSVELGEPEAEAECVLVLVRVAREMVVPLRLEEDRPVVPALTLEIVLEAISLLILELSEDSALERLAEADDAVEEAADEAEAEAEADATPPAMAPTDQ